LQQKRIGGFQFFVDLRPRSVLGPLCATYIHTSGLTLQLQKTLSLFRHVLRRSGSLVLPASPKSFLRHNFELDVNGLNYDDAKRLDQ